MGLQHYMRNTTLFSSLISYLWYRYVARSVINACILFSYTWALQLVVAITYNSFIYPRISPLRHLPTAKQRPLRQRLFKEPSPFLFARWINEIPNDGLIRYFGFLNAERVLVANPEAARQILQDHTYDFQKPPIVTVQLRHHAGTGLAYQEGNGHKLHRPVMEVAMSHKRIKRLHCMFWDKATELVNTIRQDLYAHGYFTTDDVPAKAIQGTKVDIKEYIDRSMFDMIGLALHGSDLKATASPELEYDKIRGHTEAMKPSSSHRTRMLLSLVLPGWLVNALPLKNNRLAAPAMRVMRKLGNDLISVMQCEKLDPDTPQILKAILQQNSLSTDESLNEFITLQTGNMNPPALALASTIWFLAQPKYYYTQVKLREEIQKVRPDGISERTFEKMPYLHAVLNEVLRLHSPFTLTGREPVRETVICGQKIPVGLTISLSPFALHRSTAVWGPDADEFRPERWLTKGTAGVDLRNNFLSFGGGPRTCIGEKLVMAELHCLVSALIGQLDFRFDSEEKLPRVTHYVTLGFKDTIRPTVRIIE